MPNKPKNPFLFKLAIAVGLVGIVLTSLILIGLDTRDIAAEVIESKKEVNVKIRQMNKLAQLREEAKTADSYSPRLEGALPNKDELFSFPDEIRAMASENGVNANFAFGSEGADSIEYNLSVQGTYSELVNFIKALEDKIFFISISGMDIVSQENGYVLNIKGNLFFK